MNGKKSVVLIVDDTPENIEVLVQLVPDECEILSATNGKEALELVKTEHVDLILLDIMMPEMDGYEVCRRLKQNAETKEIPVIMITALNQKEDEAKGLEAGAIDYISKPISPPIAKTRIKNHLKTMEYMHELIELNQIKNRFISIASHDLRNPLNGIMGLIDLFMMEDNIAEDVQDILVKIYKISDHMLALVNSILDISVMESGKMQLELHEDSLLNIVEKSIGLNKISAEQKKIQIVKNFTDIPTLLLDTTKMLEAVDNLLSNAIKFSPLHTKVIVSVVRERGNVKFSIQDQGPGISQEEQKKLFSAFQRLSAKPTAGENSTGLGLYITKKIIQAHKGEIWVQSHPLSGTIFSFTLPLIQKTLE